MKNLSKFAFATILAATFSTTAFASGYSCKSGPESGWKSKDSAKEMILSKGYEVRKIKVEGGCYEFYALKDGKKYEIYVNPQTLEIAKIEKD